MTQVSKYYGDNRMATVENVLNGLYIVKLYLNDVLVERHSLTRLKEAEDLAEDYILEKKD
jgi:hypothetical protein